MLQPRSYPELVGKALFLEPDPFLAMTHDDEPLAEGAVLTALLGLVVGAAQMAGNLLQATMAPAAVSLDPFVIERAPDAGVGMALWMADPVRALMLAWHGASWLDSGWWQALLLVAAPVLVMLAWLATGMLLWAIGRMAGGIGTLPQVLGANALAMTPALFYLLHLVPFTFVNLLLPLAWGLLLYYRAAQISHDLGWGRALWVTLICALLLVVMGALLGAGTLLLTSLS